MNSVKEAYSRVMCSDGWPTSINSMNSSVKLSPAKEIYASSHRREERTNCVDPSPHFWQSPTLSFMAFFWPGYQLCPAAIWQTNLGIYRIVQTHAGFRLQTKLHLTKRRLFMNHCLWSNRRAFSLEGCYGSPALWFCIKNGSRTPLCFSPYNSPVPAQTGSGGHCLEKIASPLNSVVRVWKWMFPYHEILPCIVILHHHTNQPCGNVLTNQGSSGLSNNCMFVTSSVSVFTSVRLLKARLPKIANPPHKISVNCLIRIT